MTYLDSTYFSDKFSYKILFILSYQLKDINFASFAYLQEFLEKQRKRGELFSPKGNSARVADRRGQGADEAL
jgi:hypothetical protein